VTDTGQRLTLFFSSSFADADARELREALREHFNVTTADTLVGSYVRHTALHQAIADADVVVVAVPATEDPAARNVFVEAGAALGAGRPIMLVGERSRVPVDLADLPFATADSATEVAEEIRFIATGKPVPRRGIEVQLELPTLLPAAAAQWRQRLEAGALASVEAVGVLDDVFRSAGARTKNAITAGHKVNDTPDLAVWHDGLTATVGTPLPVEVLARAASWPAVRQRLDHTLKASGGRTLLAVYLGPPVDVPRKWTDGSRTILVVAATELIDSLIDHPLPIALTRLVERAEP